VNILPGVILLLSHRLPAAGVFSGACTFEPDQYCGVHLMIIMEYKVGEHLNLVFATGVGCP
jgi:hypothetical protein